MPRLYGRKGFTEKKSVRQLLAPHEGRVGKRSVPVERLPATHAVELLVHLPEGQRDDRAHPGAPTFAEIVELAVSIPGAMVSGYRVLPDQLDERVTITQVLIPHRVLDHAGVTTLAAGVQDPNILAVGHDGSVYARWTSR